MLFSSSVAQIENRICFYLFVIYFLYRILCDHVEIWLTIVTGPMLHGFFCNDVLSVFVRDWREAPQDNCALVHRDRRCLFLSWKVSYLESITKRNYELQRRYSVTSHIRDYSKSRWKCKFLTDLLTRLISNLER